MMLRAGAEGIRKVQGLRVGASLLSYTLSSSRHG